MKALVFDKSKQDWEKSKGFLKIDVPEPKLNPKSPGDNKSVIIKVQYAGVCGSDRGIWYRRAFKDQILGSLEKEKKDIRILGHEFFGEVVEVGSEAEDLYKINVGDMVACESHVVCNECFQCRLGEHHVCTNEKILGISHDGCFAEYIKVPGHIVWKTDTSKIRPEVAAVQEPFGNAVHATTKVDVRGKTILMSGLGPIGMFSILIARGLGAKKIIGIEPRAENQEVAKKLGIDHVITPSQNSDSENYKSDKHIVKEVIKLTDGLGVDVAFEMAGFASSLNNVIQATRRGGHVILFGIKSGDAVIESYDKTIVRGLTTHAVIGRELWRTWEITRRLMEDKSNRIQEDIYNVILKKGKETIIAIDEFTNEMFETKLNEHLKLLIKF